MPVLEVDGDAVKVGYAATFGDVALLELLELQRDVGDRRVDLAREEEALTIGGRSSESFASGPGQVPEHEQERNDAGVRLGELAEVVVRGHLAPEHGVLRAHPLLDERVPDAIHEWIATGALDRLGTPQLAGRRR